MKAGGKEVNGRTGGDEGERRDGEKGSEERESGNQE